MLPKNWNSKSDGMVSIGSSGEDNLARSRRERQEDILTLRSWRLGEKSNLFSFSGSVLIRRPDDFEF